MKMIASTKLAKAQRAIQAGKEYGSANSDVVGIYLNPAFIAHSSLGKSTGLGNLWVARLSVAERVLTGCGCGLAP